MSNISIIGAGSWGTALAQMLANGGHNVLIWARSAEITAREINESHSNESYLPGIKLHENISATSDLQDVTRNKIILCVTPAQIMDNMLEQISGRLTPEHALIICSKGIELETGRLLPEVAREIAPNSTIALLSGPNFAKEIALGQPAATTLACADPIKAEELQAALHSRVFRIYTSTDIIGASICGAVKNVIAIGCGIAKGLGYGESTRAALITRGLAEISRLSEALGGQKETSMGLCGIGDLMMTCSSEQSRNFSFGLALGRGERAKTLLENSKNVTEGVYTAAAVYDLALRHNVEMPLSQAVHNCVNNGEPLDDVVASLLNRPQSHEQ